MLMEPRRKRRAKCRSSRPIQSCRIKLSSARACPGRSCDRHDLQQLGSQLYARLLLLDIAVPPRGIHGLAVRRIKLSSAMPVLGLCDRQRSEGRFGIKRGELQLEDAVENRCGVLRRGRHWRAAGDALKSLPGPENARLMRKAGEKERKRRSARWQNAQREKKSNGALE